jgi:hypothetical protein
MKRFTLLLIVCLLFTVRLISQNQEAPKVKFEKVSEEELGMKSYVNDTTAEAVILYDEGSSYIKYDLDKGFMLTHEKFVRIKILKQSGVEWGNFRIALYSNGQNAEEISALKGTTINLENGKIVKADLKKNAIFKERENKYWEAVRLSMPSVKVGSVIDLQYKIYTKITWNLRPWKFQYTIPVKWSQYSVTYPEYFNYNHSYQGYHRLLYSKQSKSNESIHFQDLGARTMGARDITAETIAYMVQVFDYAAKDVPALKPEPFLTSLNNFTTQMKFELSSIDYSRIGGDFRNFNTSWNEIAKELRDDDNFGGQLKNTGFIDDAVSAVTKGATIESKKLELIYNHLQHSMKWDGSNSIFASRNLKKAYGDKTGNTADINLLLVAMLHSAGIYADPVILSTRANGIISPAHASISDCNYVIVRVLVGEKPILLDATEPNLQFGYIPFRCLNGEGHLILGEVSKAIPLSNPKSVENTTVQVEIKNGKMTGTIQKHLFGQSAFNLRESVKSAGGAQEHFNKLKNSSTDLDYLECKYDKLDSLSQPVGVNYRIALKEGQENNVGVIYIDPVITGRPKKNPFTSPERVYPVDFGAPTMEVYNFQLTIPEGYAVEELPQSKSFALPEKGGSFVYQVAKEGDKVTLSLRLSIDKPLFLPTEYAILKSFFDIVINKQSEQIILKKIAV